MLRLITESLGDPLSDTALSTAILDAVAAGDLGETLRLFTPQRIVAFGSQDSVNDSYPLAVQDAADAGFAPVERLAGGKAAVFHEETVAFAWATPHPDPKVGIEARYDHLTGLVVDALVRLGLQGEVGEVPGEYCPGRFSVHVGGAKVMGVGQRLVRGAAHIGGVVVTGRPDLVNRALRPVYARLGYVWSPSATGATGTPVADTITALTGAFENAGHRLTPIDVPDGLRAAADGLAARHRPPIA